MNRRSPDERQPQSLRARLRETTAQAILFAAEEVFADEGLHAAHMGDIAAQAGVAVGTLYNHFADREALLAGLLEARRELIAEIDGALQASADRRSARGSAARRSACWPTTSAPEVRAHRAAGRAGRYQQTFPPAWARSATRCSEMLTRIDELKAQGVREGVRADMADLAPFFLIGMMRALVMRDAPAAPGLVAEADRLLSCLLRGRGSRPMSRPPDLSPRARARARQQVAGHALGHLRHADGRDRHVDRQRRAAAPARRARRHRRGDHLGHDRLRDRDRAWSCR